MHITLHSQVNSLTTLMLALVCGPMSRILKTRLIGKEDTEEHRHIPDHLVTILMEMASDFCIPNVTDSCLISQGLYKVYLISFNSCVEIGGQKLLALIFCSCLPNVGTESTAKKAGFNPRANIALLKYNTM